jgi:hypothetical protein
MAQVLLAPSVRASFARHYLELQNARPRDPRGLSLLASGWVLGHSLWAAEKIEHPFVQQLVGQLALGSPYVSLGLAAMLEAWNHNTREWFAGQKK